MSYNESPTPRRRESYSEVPAARPTSAMAIVALVLGILALLTSFLPIINNGSFFLALLGLIFAIIGLVGTLRGKKSGKGLAIASLVINIVAIIVVLVTQSAYSAALDEASKELAGPGVASTSTDTGAAVTDGTSATVTDTAADASAQTAQQLAVGTSITLDDGLSISVDEVQTGLVNYDDSTMIGVRVTYTNGSAEEQSFNTYDWKGQTAQGVQGYPEYYSGADDSLSSGTLAAGGTVSGMLYFNADVEQLLYYSNMFNSAPTATWSLI